MDIEISKIGERMWLVAGRVKRVIIILLMIAISIFGVVLVHIFLTNAHSEQYSYRAVDAAIGILISILALVVLKERYRDYLFDDYRMFNFYAMKKPPDVSQKEWEHWLWVVQVIGRWRVETGRYHSLLSKKDVDDIQCWLASRSHKTLLAIVRE